MGDPGRRGAAGVRAKVSLVTPTVNSPLPRQRPEAVQRVGEELGVGGGFGEWHGPA
jgi:hypothetical protein